MTGLWPPPIVRQYLLGDLPGDRRCFGLTALSSRRQHRDGLRSCGLRDDRWCILRVEYGRPSKTSPLEPATAEIAWEPAPRKNLGCDQRTVSAIEVQPGP